MIGIYSLKNNITGETYVGQSIDLHRRMMEHKCPCSTKGNRLICKALKKYGFNNFTFSVLEECQKDELDSKEVFWIKKLGATYNMTDGGKGAKGYHPSLEERAYISKCARAQWDRMTDEEKKEKLLQLTGPKVGHIVSEETREKLRKANLGKRQSFESRRKKSEANKGRLPHPPIYKAIYGFTEGGNLTFAISAL